jgi:hypothetical protein
MSRILNAQKLLDDARMSRVQNAFTPGNPAGLNGAMGFTVDIFEQLQARAYDVKMPDIKWAETLGEGLDTSINPGAKLTSYRVRDRRGKGAFRAAVGKDIPTVGVTQNKVVIPMESAAVMASADLDDIVSVAFGFEGMNLLTDLGVVMREAHERQVEETFFFGFPELDFAGYIDYALVPATTAGTKAATGTTWAVATGDEIVKDINTAIGLVYGNSKGVFLPGRVEIPLAQLVQIASQRMGGAAGASGENITVLEYVKKNNLYTSMTGRELDVRGLRYLEDAGAGVTDRMIVSQADGETNYMPMSRAFEMLAPQDRQFATDLFAHWKFGSYHKPYPTSAQFIDGI